MGLGMFCTKIIILTPTRVIRSSIITGSSVCFAIWHGIFWVSREFHSQSSFFGWSPFWIFFKLAQRFSSFFIACAFSLLSFPLIASRIDIRPELFSTLFCGLYWWLIESYKQGRLTSGRSKFWAIVLQIIGSTRIYFYYGAYFNIFFWSRQKQRIENRSPGILSIYCGGFSRPVCSTLPE